LIAPANQRSSLVYGAEPFISLVVEKRAFFGRFAGLSGNHFISRPNEMMVFDVIYNVLPVFGSPTV
jgi:hypothetical protein